MRTTAKERTDLAHGIECWKFGPDAARDLNDALRLLRKTLKNIPNGWDGMEYQIDRFLKEKP